MPHLIHLAIGFPPAAKSSTYRLRATANMFAELGWDVTVVNLHEEAWLRESGIDRSLLDEVHPNIEIVELPHGRADLEPNIRKYSRFRARHPNEWLKQERQRELKVFPEPVFGTLRPALEKAVTKIHARKPADLVIASSTPHTVLAAAWKLWQDSKVPYVVDFRDGWSLSTFKGVEAFPMDSEEGKWEKQLVENALQVWTVNPQIQEWYQERYPDHAERVKSVRNGFDAMPDFPPRAARDPEEGLTIGYLGTSSFTAGMVRSLLQGWHAARMIDPVLAKSRLVFRGHFGISAARGAQPILRLILDHEEDQASYDGPVPKAQVGEVYSSWDALMLILPGGKYVTSGKVYEYMATGLPIMSVHSPYHAADEVLADYPLWIPPPERWAPELATVSFIKTARMVQAATDDDRERARKTADKFSRRDVMIDAVREVAAATGGLPDRGSVESPGAVVSGGPR